MNILVFRTTNDERLCKILQQASKHSNNVSLVLPVKKYKFYKRQYPEITCIPTQKDYMDYDTLLLEKENYRKCYDEAWVPSSHENNEYTFGEVYNFLEELRCKRIIWISPTGKRLIMSGQDSKKEKLDYLCIKIVFELSELASKFLSKLKGYCG